MNELEALNMLLRAVGSSPVNSVDSPQPDVANARDTLDRIRRRVQKTGWWFNIDYGVIYQPAINGEIVIPSQVVSFTVNNTHNLVKRGGKLYDNINNTYKFTDNVTFSSEIRVLTWKEMPAVVQEYCAYFAASEFVRDELEDQSKETSFQKSAAQAFIDMQNQHLRDGGFNMFAQSRVIQARAGVRPYSRSSGLRFSGSPDA